MERLQRVLASRGVASRRKAEELIAQRRVRVDGKVVTEQGLQVDPERQKIEVDGKLLPIFRHRYIMLHKPSGYITTTDDERDRRTVMDLVQVSEPVVPVGRLDRPTEGLLLLTNDGDVAYRVTHPRFEIDKEYEVLLDGHPPASVLERVRRGIVVDGERLTPSIVRPIRNADEGTIVRIVIHEGRNRIIRRMFEDVGYPVLKLVRTRIGPLQLGTIPRGAWRDITDGELEQLREALHLRDEDASWTQPPARGRAPGPKPPVTSTRGHGQHPASQPVSGGGRRTEWTPPPRRGAPPVSASPGRTNSSRTRDQSRSGTQDRSPRPPAASSSDRSGRGTRQEPRPPNRTGAPSQGRPPQSKQQTGPRPAGRGAPQSEAGDRRRRDDRAQSGRHNQDPTRRSNSPRVHANDSRKGGSGARSSSPSRRSPPQGGPHQSTPRTTTSEKPRSPVPERRGQQARAGRQESAQRDRTEQRATPGVPTGESGRGERHGVRKVRGAPITLIRTRAPSRTTGDATKRAEDDRGSNELRDRDRRPGGSGEEHGR